jgi:hypothetical protein
MRRIWRAPNSIPIYSCIQQDATLHSLFISGNCSTCFGWYIHPSSGAHTTVSRASGIFHTITAICRSRGRVGTGLSVLWVDILTMHGPRNVKSPNNIRKWQMGFNSAFKGLKPHVATQLLAMILGNSFRLYLYIDMASSYGFCIIRVQSNLKNNELIFLDCIIHEVKSR